MQVSFTISNGYFEYTIPYKTVPVSLPKLLHTYFYCVSFDTFLPEGPNPTDTDVSYTSLNLED